MSIILGVLLGLLSLFGIAIGDPILCVSAMFLGGIAFGCVEDEWKWWRAKWRRTFGRKWVVRVYGGHVCVRATNYRVAQRMAAMYDHGSSVEWMP